MSHNNKKPGKRGDFINNLLGQTRHQNNTVSDICWPIAPAAYEVQSAKRSALQLALEVRDDDELIGRTTTRVRWSLM